MPIVAERASAARTSRTEGECADKRQIIDSVLTKAASTMGAIRPRPQIYPPLPRRRVGSVADRHVSDIKAERAHMRVSVNVALSPLLLAATCASLRTPPPATMGIVSKAGKLFGQFRQKRDVKDVAQLIQPGDRLPEAVVQVSANGRQMNLADAMAASSGMSLLVGMPGAFTPTCSTCHLPSLVEAAPRLERLGLKKIAVIMLGLGLWLEP